MTLLSLWLNLNLRGLPSNDRRWFEIQRDPTIDHSPGGAFCSHRVSRSFLFMDRGCGSCIDGGGQAIDVIGRVTMARHAMERTRPSAELQSAYRKLFNSRWHQEISIGYSYTGAMHCVQKPIALVDDCAARSPANIKFRKRHARNREVVFVDEQSRRQAKMDIEVSSAARAADFGVYHPDYDYFFTLQSFFGVPGNASLRFTDEARTSRAIMAIFPFASALLPLILRSKMDLNIPAART